MLHNIIDMPHILQQLKLEAYPVNSKTLTRISPYRTDHIQRFGEYVIDMNQTIDDIPFGLNL